MAPSEQRHFRLALHIDIDADIDQILADIGSPSLTREQLVAKVAATARHDAGRPAAGHDALSGLNEAFIRDGDRRRWVGMVFAERPAATEDVAADAVERRPVRELVAAGLFSDEQGLAQLHDKAAQRLASGVLVVYTPGFDDDFTRFQARGEAHRNAAAQAVRDLAAPTGPAESAPEAKDQLENRSKRELLDRAGELGIPNRHRMRKDQLAGAIVEAAKDSSAGRTAQAGEIRRESAPGREIGENPVADLKGVRVAGVGSPGLAARDREPFALAFSVRPPQPETKHTTVELHGLGPQDARQLLMVTRRLGVPRHTAEQRAALVPRARQQAPGVRQGQPSRSRAAARTSTTGSKDAAKAGEAAPARRGGDPSENRSKTRDHPNNESRRGL